MKPGGTSTECSARQLGGACRCEKCGRLRELYAAFPQYYPATDGRQRGDDEATTKATTKATEGRQRGDGGATMRRRRGDKTRWYSDEL